MSTIWTKEFWQGAGERSIKTFFQTGISVAVIDVGAEAVGVSAGVLSVSWIDVLSVAALAAILSLGTSIGNAEFTAGRSDVPPVAAVPEPEDEDDDEDVEALEPDEEDEEELEPITGDDAGAYIDGDRAEQEAVEVIAEPSPRRGETTL